MWHPSEAVLVQRGDGRYDQTANRLAYIKHLREGFRRTPRTEADTTHITAKTEMLQLTLAQKRGELVRQSDVDALMSLWASRSQPCPRCLRGVRLVAILRPDVASKRSCSKSGLRLPTSPSAKLTKPVSRRSANRADGA
jgi:hypothetical protein